MTTSRKLWLGFGTLTVFLVLSSLTILLRVRLIAGDALEIESARKRTAATSQMEINVLGYALDVRAHFQTHGSGPRQDAAKDAAEVERHLAEYAALLTTDLQRQMAARFASTWKELNELGQALLSAEDRELKPEGSRRFYVLRKRLHGLLDEVMQVEAKRAYDKRRDAALEATRGIVGLAWLVLVAGAAIALATSVAVGRGIVRAEKRLWTNRERLRITLASIGDAVITTDARGRVTYLNAVAEALTGWKSAEAEGVALEEVFRIVDEATRQTAESPAARAMREGVVVGLANHAVLIAKDGTERPIDDSAAPIRDEQGKIAGAVLVFRDITERTFARDEALERERRLRFVINSMPQMVFTAGQDGSVDYFNPQWTEFTELSQESILGWGWRQFIHPDDWAETERAWRQSIDSGEPFEREHRLRRGDGEYRWHSARAVSLRGPRGRISIWVGTNTDIHKQKETATELRRLAADLSEADRRKNEFMATLAHELRNPLAPLRNSLRILRLTMDEGKAVDSASSVAMMERHVDQMVRLVEDLLDVNRISRGRIELRKERTLLGAVVAHAVEVARPLIESSGHELAVALPEDPIQLNVDPTRLVQIVGNLLNNACKYTEAGGRIWLTALREGDEVVLRIRDTGIGIAVDQLPHIFEIFAQADPALDRYQSGLGIGLALVKRLVELHDGTVGAHSAGLGQGSEFSVRLPIVDLPMADAQAELPPRPAASEPKAASSRRILVVDDNQDAATSLALLLDLNGNQTQTAFDGLEAVEAAATFSPDVVVLDIGLPKLNGYEVARKIREQPWGKSMVLIALTGWGQDEDRRKSTEAGFDTHLVKPVDTVVLMKLLAAKARERPVDV